MEQQAAIAQARWKLENGVSTSAESDAYYTYNREEQQAILKEKPWKKDPHYFKSVKISALALLKMAMHARSGGNLEVMGMMQGKIQGTSFIVLDAFALPVEGTETRVNAQEEAYEYMVDYSDSCTCALRLQQLPPGVSCPADELALEHMLPPHLDSKHDWKHGYQSIQRMETIVGWYHSHPGYGCWLSGIDCSTQMTQQQFQDPFLAVVVDPHRTMAAGKVEIGAFRTYPEDYKPPDEGPSEYQTIPLNKIEDFGVHCKRYYSLEVTFFKSSTDAYLLDLLWHKYWANTLSASPLLNTNELTNQQLSDICDKLEQALPSSGTLAPAARGAAGGSASAGYKGDRPLDKVCRDVCNLAVEQLKGLSSQAIKALLFNHKVAGPGGCRLAPADSGAEPMDT